MQRRLKKLAFFLGFAISIPGFAGAGEGQAVPSAAAESFDIGGRRIRVPAPDGFTGVLTRYKHFAPRFTGTESPELEMLAVHVSRQAQWRCPLRNYRLRQLELRPVLTVMNSYIDMNAVD